MRNQAMKYSLLIVFVLWSLPVFAEEVGITILDLNSSDVSWSPNGKWIAYAKVSPKEDKFNDVWLVRPDATDHVNLSKNWKSLAGFPHMHVGGITWHPSMEYIVIVALNNDVTGKRFQQLGIPGSGINCNLWLAYTDGTKVWQLTKYKTNYSKPKGVIHPQFSPDGKKLIWAENTGKYPGKDDVIDVWGKWIIKVADFKITKKGPKLKKIRKYKPGGQQFFYETHHFSSNGSKALFCGNLVKDQPLNGMDIYELNIKNGKVKRLTNTLTDWDEHAHYSPDGTLICWSSGAGFDIFFPTLRAPDWKQYVQLDLWIMNADRSGKQRVTFFNEPGHADQEWFYDNIYESPRIVTSDNAWSPDGKSIVLTAAYEGPDNSLGSLLIIIDMEKRLRALVS